MFLYLLALIGIHKNISVFINIIGDDIITVCKLLFHIQDSDEHVKVSALAGDRRFRAGASQTTCGPLWQRPASRN